MYGATDRLSWWPAKNDIFSVKSVYFLKINRNKQNEGESLKTNDDNGLWTTLQKLQISTTTKYFFWKVCHDIFPTVMNLCRRKIIDDPICPIYLQEDATIFHILWKCVATNDVWGRHYYSYEEMGDNSTRHFGSLDGNGGKFADHIPIMLYPNLLKFMA